LLDNGLNLLNLLDLLDLLLDLLDLRSLYLVFNFIVFNSFDLSGLGNVVGYFLSNVFSSLYGNVFGFLNGDLFLDGVYDGSGYVFFLVFYGLVISFEYFSRNSFDIFSFYFLVLEYILFNVFDDSFLNISIFNLSSFDGVVFNSGFSLDRLDLLGDYLRLLLDYLYLGLDVLGLHYLRRDEGLLLNNSYGRSLVYLSRGEVLGTEITLLLGTFGLLRNNFVLDGLLRLLLLLFLRGFVELLLIGNFVLILL